MFLNDNQYFYVGENAHWDIYTPLANPYPKKIFYFFFHFRYMYIVTNKSQKNFL